MSPARQITTSPEGTKRRRLSTSSPTRFGLPTSTMSPLLIQVAEEDADVPKTLELTSVEATLRRLLLDVAEYIDKSPTLSDPDSAVTLPPDLVNEQVSILN